MEEDGGVRVTGMRYTIVLTVYMYFHRDRFLKQIYSLSMLSHHALKHGECVFAYHCQRSAMSNPFSIVRRVKNQFVVFDFKS